MVENSGHETGAISVVAFSFIVQEPSGIIECARERSFDSRWWIYRNISVSEWWVLNTGWVRYGDVLQSVPRISLGAVSLNDSKSTRPFILEKFAKMEMTVFICSSPTVSSSEIPILVGLKRLKYIAESRADS